MNEIRKCPFCDEGELHLFPEFSLVYNKTTRGRGIQRKEIEALLCNECGMIAFRKVNDIGKAEG